MPTPKLLSSSEDLRSWGPQVSIKRPVPGLEKDRSSGAPLSHCVVVMGVSSDLILGGAFTFFVYHAINFYRVRSKVRPSLSLLEGEGFWFTNLALCR